MRTLIALTVLGVVGVFSSLIPQAALADDKIVKVEQDWTASSNAKEDNGLWKEEPNYGAGAVFGRGVTREAWWLAISGPKAWAKLWAKCNGDKEVPKVDFEKEIVLAVVARGGAVLGVRPLQLDESSNLAFTFNIGGAAGDGFRATFLKVSREGIKTVNGKTLPKE
jgi:hypothetical protein